MKVLNRPISIISWTKKDGTLVPVKMRLTKDNQEHLSIPIDKIITTHQQKIAGEMVYRFTCQVCLHGFIKLCEIRYYCDKMVWTLFKI